MKRVIIAAGDPTHQRKIQAILKKLESEGYYVDSDTARNYADTAAQLIASVEDVDEWYQDTEKNYPQDLKELETQMEHYLWEIISEIPNAGIQRITLAEEWDHVIVDFEPTNRYEEIERQIVDAFKKAGHTAHVEYNTGTEIVLNVPGLE